MSLGLVGRKVGMTRVFTDDGSAVPVTVLDVGEQPRHADQDAGERRLRRRPGHVRQAPRVARRQAAGRPSRQGGRRGRRAAAANSTSPPTSSPSSSRATSIGVDTFAVGQLVDVTGTTKGRGFSGVITRHNFSSNRATHGNSRSHNTPGSISMAQDPGRVFPGKRMAGQHGNVTRTVQTLTVVRVDTERGLLLVKGACPAPTAATSSCVPPSRRRRRREPDDGTQAASTTRARRPRRSPASDALFGRDYNEALIHQVVTAYQANARQGTRAQKARGEINKSHKKPWARRAPAARAPARPTARCGAAAARSSRTRPTRISRRRSTARCTAPGIASILSQLVREDRLSVIEALALDAPKTKLFAQKMKGYGLAGTVLDRHRQARRQRLPRRRATCRTCWCSRRARSIR